MKKIITIATLCMLSGMVNAQDPHLSQYFNVPVFYNPALAGNGIQNMRIAVDYRNQWLAPGLSNKTQTIALDKIVNKVGFGLMVSKNSAGKDGFSRLSVLGGISYHANFGYQKRHQLSSGFQVGILQKSFDPNKLTFESQYTPDIGYDPSASNGETFANTKVTRPDINAGIAYHYAQGNKEILIKPFAGASFSHINKPKESFIEEQNVNPIRMNFHGGVTITCSKTIDMKPLVYFMKQDGFQEMSAGIISELSLSNNSLVKLGLLYRNNDAMVAYAGYQFNKVFLGTSYDFNTSKYKPGGSGAYEISLVYTPQGRAKGKRNEERKPEPVNRKKLPEQKATPPQVLTPAPVITPSIIEQNPIVVSLAEMSMKGESKMNEKTELSEYNYQTIGYVVFQNYSLKYDINNRFDVIEATIDYLYKNSNRRIIVSGNASEAELNKNSSIGKQRAETVKAYMIDKGIDADRIITVDVKDKMPALMTEEGTQVERLSRTDILLIK